ncbi:hypothetical protein B0J12DRAFT_730239 [Macrophomina phaseolina]|uniref:FAD linked oxidase N-terminal domain-containing protein n=1 Tax=Macrophomina phaseolina TaxID=35725 RepID=A0ABQ8G6E1_9PEZI|nr:hypothetical protein B0J12DRAFT_730239 [Macrophomina phaseolina]
MYHFLLFDLIDLKNLNELTIAGDTQIATIGPTDSLQVVVEGRHSNGKCMISHGTSSTVGIGGHTTVGGFEPATRRDGLALGSLRSVEVVLANGTEFEFNTKPQLFKPPSKPGNPRRRLHPPPRPLHLRRHPKPPPTTPHHPTRAALLIRGSFFGTHAAFDALALHMRLPITSPASTTVTEAPWLDTYRAAFRLADALPSNAILAALVAHLLRAENLGDATRTGRRCGAALGGEAVWFADGAVEVLSDGQ